MPQTISQTISPIPYHLDRTASPVPQGGHSIVSPISQASFQTTSPLPAYFRATQAPPTAGLGTTPTPLPQTLYQTAIPLPASLSANAPSTAGLDSTQSLIPPGVNQTAECSSKPSTSFSSLAVAQVTPDSPEDYTMRDSGVVSESEVASDTPSQSSWATVVAGNGRKRRLGHSMASRSLQASVKDVVPSYPVKESKKFPGQLRGIDWLKKEAMVKFQNFYQGLLTQWGVAPGYTGTCVLVPEAYRPLEPLDIMAKIIQDEESYARPGTPRAFFAMYDHGTTVARALAWFSEWPRKGAHLDNFIGSGEYAPMDASHTCHHDHCLIHITYEAADVNVSREDCCREARRLRRQNAADVPEHCSAHQPPCLMQVSDQAPES